MSKATKRTKPAEQLGFDLKGHGAMLRFDQFYEDRVVLEINGQSVAIDAVSFYAALDGFRSVVLPSDWPGHINTWKPRIAPSG